MKTKYLRQCLDYLLYVILAIIIFMMIIFMAFSESMIFICVIES